MIFKNAELHNVAELIHNADGSVSWMRVPSDVHEAIESSQGKRTAVNSTGVELRFVLKGEQAVIRMCTSESDGIFHVFRGGLQGSWEDNEERKLVNTEVREYVIKKSANMDKLKIMTERIGLPWDCEVVRVILDRGYFKLYDIEGDIEPPTPEQCPGSTLLSYGSSITHGSNSIDMSHSWVSILAHNLNIDARNLGMAGSCAMEPAMVDYIASEGEKGRWDIATLELGINVLPWKEPKIIERVTNTLQQVAGRNPEKPVFVISPFYYLGDDLASTGHTSKWRRLIEQVVNTLKLPNVTYINGLDIIGDMSFMCADEVHPNIYGVQQIADRMTAIVKAVLAEYAEK